MIAAALDWSWIATLLITLIISLTVHEAAHALVALLGGDPTAYRGGQVTLNPLPHMRREPVGMLILPLLTALMTNGNSCMGFAHVPLDPVWAWHHPRKAALVSAAGPLANFLLAAIAFVVLASMGLPESSTGDAVFRIALLFLHLNLLLGLFNLVPLPPFDGAGIVSGLVPATRGLYDAIARIPNFSMIVLIALFWGFPKFFDPIMRAVIDWLPF